MCKHACEPLLCTAALFVSGRLHLAIHTLGSPPPPHPTATQVSAIDMWGAALMKIAWPVIFWICSKLDMIGAAWTGAWGAIKPAAEDGWPATACAAAAAAAAAACVHALAGQRPPPVHSCTSIPSPCLLDHAFAGWVQGRVAYCLALYTVLSVDLFPFAADAKSGGLDLSEETRQKASDVGWEALFAARAALVQR